MVTDCMLIIIRARRYSTPNRFVRFYPLLDVVSSAVCVLKNSECVSVIVQFYTVLELHGIVPNETVVLLRYADANVN